MEHSEAYQAGRIVGALLMFILLVGGFGFFIFALVKACTRKSTGWIVTTVVMGVLGIGLVGLFVAAVATGIVTAAKQAKTEKVLTSEDGRYSISVPGSWKAQPELNDVACIEGGNAFANRYAIVIAEDRDDVEDSLVEYATFTANQMGSGIEDGEVTEPESITVGGYPAVRHRISGTMEKHKVSYHHTCVETPTSLCQIMCWSLKSDEKSAKPVFDKVAESFVEKPE